MKNKLIIESGSTKADWAVIKTNGSTVQFQSIGLNPKILSKEKITSLVSSQLREFESDKTDEVFFYGAGILGFENQIEDAFLQAIPSAKVSVQSDLQAAAISSSFGEKIVCILGTGSFVGHFQERKLLCSRLGHGYIIGDVCSGSEFGKILIRDYLNEEVPNKIAAEIELSPMEIKKELYSQAFPNRFLATFFPLLCTQRKEKYIHSLIRDQIQLLEEKGISPLDPSKNLPITFVGGVAIQLKQELNTQFEQKRNVEFIERPIQKLVEFHLNDLKKEN